MTTFPRSAMALLVLALLAGCATTARRPAGVPVESRPTPTPPPEVREDSGAVAPGSAEEAVRPSEPPSTERDRDALLTRIKADTLAASQAIRRCANRTLLPDQEGIFESTRGYLLQARAALVRDELWRAESLARKARQLSLSLDCR